jgi:hypothetical protein
MLRVFVTVIFAGVFCDVVKEVVVKDVNAVADVKFKVGDACPVAQLESGARFTNV